MKLKCPLVGVVAAEAPVSLLHFADGPTAPRWSHHPIAAAPGSDSQSLLVEALPPGSDPHSLLVEALPHIEKIVASYGRRHRLAPEDTEDLASEVKLKLLADDCAVLRQFEGRSLLSTYLTTVVHHLMLDLRCAQSGRWRASAGAQALGDVAVDLEREIDRSGRSTDEAVALVASKRGIEPGEVAAVARKLPVRALGRSRPAQGVDLDQDQILSSQADPETLAVAATLQLERARVEQALADVLAQLPRRDVFILRMRFAEGLEIGAIADLFKEPRRPFYRAVAQLVAKLRGPLEARGVAASTVQSLLDYGDLGAPSTGPPQRQSVRFLGTGADCPFLQAGAPPNRCGASASGEPGGGGSCLDREG